MINTVPVCLANLTSIAALSLTWETLPGAEATSAMCITWIESMTRILGRFFSAIAQTVSTEVSAIISSFWVGKPKRLARMATCWGDSSPVTYNALLLSAMAQSVCSNTVLLPAPGSPPSSTQDPGTNPPPRTKSNSPVPELILGISSRAISARVLTTLSTLPAKPERNAEPPLEGLPRRTSESVFHALHSLHWPCHFP